MRERARDKKEEKTILFSDVHLKGWQQNIIEAIDGHEYLRESEEWAGHPEYKLNKDLGIFVAMPKSSGHTFLSNYVASKFPAILIYGDMDHFREITSHFPLHPQSETVSLYEIFYAVFKPSNHQPSPEFVAIKKKFENKKAVVVDNGFSLENNLKDVIFNTAQSAVVLLGH